MLPSTLKYILGISMLMTLVHEMNGNVNETALNQVENVGQSACDKSANNITVSLFVQNKLVRPYMFFKSTIVQEQTPLIYFLQKAADSDKRFMFNATYYPMPLGYYITAINHVEANTANKTYWSLWDIVSMDFLDTGVSTYIPMDGDQILFNFTNFA